MDLIDYHLNDILFAFLLSIRLTALFISMPIFSQLKMALMPQVILPVSIAFLIAPAIKIHVPELIGGNVVIFALSIFKEALVGLVMGFSVRLIFVLASVAGDIIGLSAGFAIATIFDPNLGGNVSLPAFFLRSFLILAFFIFDIHHDFIFYLVKSYESIPPGPDFFSVSEMLPGIVKLFSESYFMAFRLGLPVIFVILLAHLTTGVIAVTAPQMNFYFNAAISLNILIAMFIVAMSIGLLFKFFQLEIMQLKEFIMVYMLQ